MKLMHAVLCADLECSEVWDLRDRRQCPACGSLLFLPLSRCLNRDRGESRTVDNILDEWEAAYPEDVFRPFTAADHPHVSPDRIAAQMARHVVREIRKQIAEASHTDPDRDPDRGPHPLSGFTPDLQR